MPFGLGALWDGLFSAGQPMPECTRVCRSCPSTAVLHAKCSTGTERSRPSRPADGIAQVLTTEAARVGSARIGLVVSPVAAQ
jgi:hypothetical protein